MQYTAQQTTFCLHAPKDAECVKVRIYASAYSESPVAEHSMLCSGGDQWTLSVRGDWLNHYYTFDIGLGECPGTFAKAVGVNGHRAAIIDLRATDPEGWAADTRPHIDSPSDLVVYEVHHRDFSIHPAGGYAHPGKFLALAEPKATFYLRSLGINAVQLQPSYDFATVNEAHPECEQYNWGYDPLNYNVPEGSYATDACDPYVRIREFKTMVQALHKAGIRVIMDVVYNHCYSIADSNFQRTFPDRYYRTVSDHSDPSAPPQKRYSNGSGCGSETASERELMRRYMVESMTYWVREYHVDGFRIDLMGVHDIATMNAVRKALHDIDPTITIYGEGWSAGPCALPYEQLATKQAVPEMPCIGAFGDELRDALRGPNCDPTKRGWTGGVAGLDETIRFGLVGGISHPDIDMDRVIYTHTPWTTEPWQYVAYASCHDDLCLTDHLRCSHPKASQDEIMHMDMLAQTPVLLSQAMPFIYAGEEVLRSKQGVRNTYRSPDSINRIDWNHLRLYPQAFLYYRGLIQMRHDHKSFRLGTAELVRRYVHFLPSPHNVVAMHIDAGNAVGDSWTDIYVLMNPNRRTERVALPQGSYTVVCRRYQVNPGGLARSRGGSVSVPGCSVTILISSKQ